MFIANGAEEFALRQEGHVYSQRCSGFALRLLQTSTAIFARCILKRA